MNTNKKLSIIRELLHSDKEEVAQLVALLWQDKIIFDYLTTHLPDLDMEEIDEDSVKILACHAILHFLTTSERANGVTFTHWEENTPEELKSSFYEFHEGDDWRYEQLYVFAEAYIEEQVDYVNDSMVDVYTHDLLDWLQGNTDRFQYVTRSEVEFQVLASGRNFFDLLQRAQLMELQHLCFIMETCLEELVCDHIDLDDINLKSEGETSSWQSCFV